MIVSTTKTILKSHHLVQAAQASRGEPQAETELIQGRNEYQKDFIAVVEFTTKTQKSKS
jgi:hypothetical protein